MTGKEFWTIFRADDTVWEQDGKVAPGWSKRLEDGGFSAVIRNPTLGIGYYCFYDDQIKAFSFKCGTDRES